MEETLIPEELQQVELKTIHPLTNSVIGVFSFFCYFFLSIYIIEGNLGSTFNVTTSIIIIFLTSSFGAYFTAKILSQSSTIIKVGNGNLEVSSETNFLSIFRRTDINLHEIKGYEFFENRIFKQLIIYRINRSPYILTLTGNDTFGLKKFLNGFTILIDRKNRLSTLSFITFFFKITLLILGVLVIQILVLLFFDLHSIQVYGHHLVIHFQVVWKLILINIFLILLLKKFFRKGTVRITGQYSCYFAILFNLLPLLGILNYAQQLSYNQITIIKPEEIFTHRADKIFIIKGNAKTDTSIIAHHQTINKNNRSASITFTHYFVSPVNTFQTDWYRLWVGQTFKQKGRQGLQSLQDNKSFLERKKQEFQRSLSDTPRFYEVVYSDFNQSFDQKGFFSSAIASYKSVVPLIVLQPHFETFDVYQKAIIKQMGIVVLMITGLITFCAGIAAYHR